MPPSPTPTMPTTPNPSAPRLPRRDRIAILTSLAATTAIAWAYLILLTVRMQGMGTMAAATGAMPGMEWMTLEAWTAEDFALMFLMWAVMMVGMMVPTAAPMVLIYAAVERKARRESETGGSVALFVVGYIAIWTLFSLAATFGQWGLERAALLSPMMVSTSPLLGALLLVAAGVYQWTPYKDACLEHCRGPVHFIAKHWRRGAAGAFRMGLVHGAYCLGCCWALMGLLFVGGVMNLLWIAAITLFVLAEKLLPLGRLGANEWASRGSGAAMIAVGLLFAARWFAT